MPVGGSSEGCGDRRTRSVDSLPDVAAIDPTGDLFDENGSEALRPQVLVYAEEVDLSAHHYATIQVHLDRNSSDQAE